MVLRDKIRFWFGILPKNASVRLDRLEKRCLDAAAESGVNPPALFKNNLCAMAAWWAIPYHIYLCEEFEPREITPRLVKMASKRISALVQWEMSLDADNKNHGYEQVSEAMDMVVFDMCRLWEAVFREHFAQTPAANYQQTVAYLEKIFTDPQLDLADKLWLYFETEREKASNIEFTDDDEEGMSDLEDFSDAVARFYYICAQRPFSGKIR